MKTRLLLGAFCLAAASALPALAQQAAGWDDFLRDAKATGAGWFAGIKGGIMDITGYKKPITLNMCWASDKTAFVNDPAVVDAWQQEPENKKIKIEFPRDAGKRLLGSGEIMTKWDSGELNCDSVSPDASIVGMRFSKWNPDETLMYASSMVVAVVHPDVAPVLGKLYGKDPKALTFPELVRVAGKPWAEIDPTKEQWGMVKVLATNCALSASCQVVAVSLPYSVTGKWTLSGREVTDPKVKEVMDDFRAKVDHSEASTGRLSQTCYANPIACDVFFTYESQIPQIEKQIPGAVIVYGDRVVLADQVAMVTASDPAAKAATVRFLDPIRSPQIQKLLAEKYGFRPAVVVDVEGPVAKLKQQRLGFVKPNAGLVKAVLANVAAHP